MLFSVKSHFTNLKESATLAINEKVKKLRETNKEVYHFGFGQSPFPVHITIQEELKRNSHQKDYLSTKGLLPLRRAISEYLLKKHNENFLPENIFIGPGSKELIYQVMLLYDGEILIPAPSWVSYGPQIRMTGKQPKIIKTLKENHYRLSGRLLESYCSKNNIKNALLILTSPGNPSGIVYSSNELEHISKVCKARNIVILSDEIYSEINFIGKKGGDFQRWYPEGVMVTGGLSKIFSAGGYRLGFLAIPEGFTSLNKALSASVSETFSCVSSPIQWAAIKAFLPSPELEMEVQLYIKIHHATSSYLFNRFKEMNIAGPTPEGAFYLMVDFSNYRSKLEKRKIFGSRKLGKILLDEISVAMLPGTDFYLDDSELVFRVSTVDYDGTNVLTAARESLAKKQKLDDSFIENHCPNLKNGCKVLKTWLAQL